MVWEDYSVCVFDRDEISEVMRGAEKLREHERKEAEWWYPVQSKLCSIYRNLESGALRGDERCVREALREAFDQGNERIAYLENMSRARSKRTKYTVKYFREINDDEVEDRSSDTAFRGRQGQKHEIQKKSMRKAREHARAKAYYKYTGKDDGKDDDDA